MPLPFPVHIRRDGEPAFPSFVSHGETQTIDMEKRKSWREWAMQQPDSRLLTTEYLFTQLWASSKEDMYPEEISLVREEQVKEAIRLHEAGYGDIIEKYWSYLLSYQPPSK